MPGDSLGSRRRTRSNAVVAYLPGAAETATVPDTKFEKLLFTVYWSAAQLFSGGNNLHCLRCSTWVGKVVVLQRLKNH
jgi:hypothetical protein